MGNNHPNMTLVIMRTDLLAPGAAKKKGPRLVEPKSGTKLVVTLLDPLLRSPCAPMAAIPLDGRQLKPYNEILRRTQALRAKFYEDGFIDRPTTYTPDRQNEVFKAAEDIGIALADLFHTSEHVHRWLLGLFGTAAESEGGEEPLPPVTIITNDLEMPWFWLRQSGLFLCEVCSLGTLQLSATEGLGDTSRGERRRDKEGQALLIKGERTKGYPFLDEDLQRIKKRLEEPYTGVPQYFGVSQAATGEDIEKIWPRWPLRTTTYPNIRIVHYSGHYSGDQLFLAGTQVPLSELGKHLADCLLVLDASSDERAGDVWADIEGLTPALSQGALGCIVTALPVKDDPIVNRILWDTFYRNLRCETETVGSALAKARNTLRDYFASIGSPNPAWAAYQLIGSPVVRMCESGESR